MGCGCGGGSKTIANKQNNTPFAPIAIGPNSPGDIMFVVNKVDENFFTVSYPLVGTPGVSLVAIKFIDKTSTLPVPGGIDEKSLLEILKMRLASDDQAQLYLDALIQIVSV